MSPQGDPMGGCNPEQAVNGDPDLTEAAVSKAFHKGHQITVYRSSTSCLFAIYNQPHSSLQAHMTMTYFVFLQKQKVRMSQCFTLIKKDLKKTEVI